MQIKFKKLNKKAVIPTKAHPTDVGYDLVAVTKIYTDKYVEYGLGLAMAIPEGHAGLIFANSRVSKYDLDLSNAVAVLDPPFRGEVRLRYKHTTVPQTAVSVQTNTCLGFVTDVEVEPVIVPFTPKEFNVGDVVGQLVVIPVPELEFIETDTLDETDRGEGGFGSTETPVETVVETELASVEVVVTPIKTSKKRGRKPKKK